MIDYDRCVRSAPAPDSYDHLVLFLARELPQTWLDEYAIVAGRRTDVALLTVNGFDYLVDFNLRSEPMGVIGEDGREQFRVVAAFGRSAQTPGRRADSRMRGWARPRGRALGDDAWDIAHRISPMIGGGTDGAEINLFLLRRGLNRGWTERGRVYRRMQYCARSPGTFCFHRPLYASGTWPSLRFEFGVLKPDGTLWVEGFDN